MTRPEQLPPRKLSITERLALKAEADRWSTFETSHRERMKTALNVEWVVLVIHPDTWDFVQREAQRTNGYPIPTKESDGPAPGEANLVITLTATGFVQLLGAMWEAVRHAEQNSARYTLARSVYYAPEAPMDKARKGAVKDTRRSGGSYREIIPSFIVNVDHSGIPVDEG